MTPEEHAKVWDMLVQQLGKLADKYHPTQDGPYAYFEREASFAARVRNAYRHANVTTGDTSPEAEG